jgi:hypothetical protein
MPPLTPVQQGRIEEAVAALARYNRDPFITDFIRAQPPPRIPAGRYPKDELCDLIRQILLGEQKGKKKYVLHLEDLIAHLDRLQETGRQHLYWFRLPDDRRDVLLTRLRDLEDFSAQEDLDGQGPQLLRVRHDPATGAMPPRLLLQWVERRAFWVPQQPIASPDLREEHEEEEEGEEPEAATQQKVQVWVQGEERAATYFVVDLDRGECELRIQALHGNSMAARREQLAKYRALVAEFLGFEPLGPVVLAPAIRRALTAREVAIVRCSAVLPDGGVFVGRKGEFPPVDVRRLQAGVTLRFDWPQPSGGIGRIGLDGRLDEILILRPLLPEQHLLLAERIRRWRHEGLAGFTAVGEPGPVVLGPPVPGAPPEPEFLVPAMTPGTLVALLKAALGGALTEPPQFDRGIDRAVREYDRTHSLGVEGEAASPTVRTEDSRGVPTTHDAVDIRRAQEQFLGYIQEVARTEHSTYQRELKRVRFEETWIFRLFLAAMVLALSILAVGAFFLFRPGGVPLGAVTEFLGLLTGSGTLLIRSHAESLKKKRELIEDSQQDNYKTLSAIQMVLSIPDLPARSIAMGQVATTLLGRV